MVDADESNRCLHRLLGARLPQVLMDAMGGTQRGQGTAQPRSSGRIGCSGVEGLPDLADIPPDCLADAAGVELLVVGKIRAFGEGCACTIGNLFKTILDRLQVKENEVVVIDAEAGLEHFGRRVNTGCDLILCVVDPTFESVALADAVRQMAAAAGIRNKVDDAVGAIMARNGAPGREPLQSP